MKERKISKPIKSFRDRPAPEPGLLVGYGALIEAFHLKVPLPDQLSLIAEKHKKYRTETWAVFSPRYQPEETLAGHLTFALKNEGIALDVLKALFSQVKPAEIEAIILNEPTGRYSRKIWFLYEWLLGTTQNIPDLNQGSYVELVDPAMQYPGPARQARRYRITNNLPGVPAFCPMVRRTEKLDQYIRQDLSGRLKASIGKIRSGVLARAAAFLLLKDSKASYAIEGERPPQTRTHRWARSIGQAGQKPLSKEELLRLQQIVIDNDRSIKMGYRMEGGFIGEHDRGTGSPIPGHISAKWQDLDSLMDGLIAMNELLEDGAYDAVMAAAAVAFGFVFIHPFADGNGRIHRYLFHHTLIRKDFAPKGFIFPVSSVILERLNEYRQVLEHFSLPRLDFIDWKPTLKNNVEVLNETSDLYRYFDATRQVEFLYSCVEQTVTQTIPEEVAYLEKYDRMKQFLDDHFEMPDNLVALLVMFLEQGKGKLSNRAREKEFEALKENEITAIEEKFQEIFF